MIGREGRGGKTTLRRALLTVLVAVIMSLGLAGTAYALGPFNVGGGKWYHSSQINLTVYSDYLHRYRCHTSTVYNGRYHPSGRREAGYWAEASAPARLRKVDRAYWNNHC